MKRLVSSVLAIICLVFVSQCYALGTSPWTTVTLIEQGPGDSPLFKLADAGNASTGCTATAGWIRLNAPDTNPAVKRQLVTILSALESGKQVQITTSTCSSDYPYLETVYIRG